MSFNYNFPQLFNIDKFSKFLLLLLPPALVSGPAIPDIIMSLLGLIFLIRFFQEKLFHYFLNPISILFLIFYFIILLSSFSSDMIFQSLFEREAIFYFRFYFFSLSICYFIQKNPLNSSFIMYSFLLTILLIIIDGSFEYFRGISLFGVEAGHSRLFSLFIDEPIVGRYISSSAMLFISIYIYRFGLNNLRKNVLLISIYLFASVFTFMSGERVAFGSILLFGISFFLLSDKKNLGNISIFILLLVSIFVLTLNNERSISRFDETVKDINNRDFFFIAASSVHDSHYQSSILMFKDHPILGIGSNLFRDNCHKINYVVSDKSCTTHPHHYYFQVLAENGLIGFAIFSILFTFIFYKLLMHFLYNFRIIKYKNIIQSQFLPFYLFLAMMLFPFWPSGSLYNSWTNVNIFLGLGFFIIPFVNKFKKIKL